MGYYDEDLVRDMTAEVITQTGSRLLQAHRFAADDSQHAAQLLALFDLPPAATVADIGCGVGELAALMHVHRPDLKFLLVNPSQAQLDMCPPAFEKLRASAETLPIERGDVDALLVTYALGHIDLQLFAQQAQRILGAGQRLCIFDLFKDAPTLPCRLSSDLNYAELLLEDVAGVFEEHGFTMKAYAPTHLLPPKTLAVMPSEHTLSNTVSAAAVFERITE